MSMLRFLVAIVCLFIILRYAPSAISSLYHQYSEMMEPKSHVGVVTICGPINDSDTYVENLKHFFEDKQIKAILLRCETPGGTAGSSQALYQEINKLKKEHLKPIITLVIDGCTSGGYYVASATDYIISTPGAFVGSVGSYIAVPQIKKFIEQYNARYEIVHSGDYKTVCNPFTELTPEQRTFMQNLTDDVYQQFVYDVAHSRPRLSVDKAHEWANGKIFTGKQALALGLIDEVGCLSTAEGVLRQQAGIEGEIEWKHAAQKKESMLSWISDVIGAKECLKELSNASTYHSIIPQT